MNEAERADLEVETVSRMARVLMSGLNAALEPYEEAKRVRMLEAVLFTMVMSADDLVGDGGLSLRIAKTLNEMPF